MGKKIGRNDPCWCGSGKKYKKCHYKRERKEEVSWNDINQETKKAYKRQECLHPEAPHNCQGDIIKAHTIQKNGGLSKIARDGHVYTPITIPPSPDGRIHFKKKGINRASTFTGFCRYHDNLLFSPIEDNSLDVCEQHAFLFAFRAICKEVFAKKVALSLIPFGRGLDKGKNLPAQVKIQQHFHEIKLAIERSIYDLEHTKGIMNHVLLLKDYSSVLYYAIILDKIPDFLCTGTFYPEFDFQGQSLQNLLVFNIDAYSLSELMTFSLLATENYGIALFAWVEESNINVDFITSLHSIPDSMLSHAIVRFAFEYFEDIYISPDWWENLSVDSREKLIKRFEVSASMHSIRQHHCLMDDEIRVVDWKIQGRHTNIPSIET